MVNGAGRDALVEEEHGELQTPEKGDVAVPCGKLNLGSICESRNVVFGEVWNVCFRDYDVLTTVVDNVDGSSVEGVEQKGLYLVSKLRVEQPHDRRILTKTET